MSMFNKYFSDFKSVVSKFSCLDPKNHFDKGAVDDIKYLAELYKMDVDRSAVGGEFLAFRSLIKNQREQKKKLNTVGDVLLHMIKYKLKNLFPNVYKLLRIFLTIPISAATAERKFFRN